MKKQNQQKKSVVKIRLWSYAEAVKGVPYLRTVLQSVREHWLDMRQAKRQLQRIDARPGRPDRRALIVRQEVEQESRSALARLEETFAELMKMSVYLLDPAGGVALIPFHGKTGMAWLVFDLFSPDGLDGWRYHTDPLETRRPMEEIQQQELTAPAVSAFFSQDVTHQDVYYPVRS
jgi:hypothetical protein